MYPFLIRKCTISYLLLPNLGQSLNSKIGNESDGVLKGEGFLYRQHSSLSSYPCRTFSNHMLAIEGCGVLARQR